MKIRRIDFSPDEWIAGTLELTNEERGLYITACALIYSRGGPIETAVLRAFSPGDLRPFKRILKRLIDLGKLQLNGSEISQKRCVSELELSRKRVGTSVENGRKGGRPSKDNKELDKPAGSLSRARNHQLSTINYQEETPHTPRQRGAVAGEFEAWWQSYPHKVGKGAAERAWPIARRLASAAELTDGVTRYIQSKPPDRAWCGPAVWLNQKRWLDEPAGTEEALSNGKVAGPTGPPPSVEELFGNDERRAVGLAH